MWFRSRSRASPHGADADGADVAILEEATRLAPAAHAVFRPLGGSGGGVLVHQRTTAYFRVNGLGARIWELLAARATFGELVDALRQELDDPPADLDRDVGAFIRELLRRDLLARPPVS